MRLHPDTVRDRLSPIRHRYRHRQHLIVAIESAGSLHYHWSHPLSSTGKTALHFAALVGSSDCTLILLENGSDPNLPDLSGMSAFVQAEHQGFDHILKILVSATLHVMSISPFLPLAPPLLFSLYLLFSSPYSSSSLLLIPPLSHTDPVPERLQRRGPSAEEQGRGVRLPHMHVRVRGVSRDGRNEGPHRHLHIQETRLS